MRHLSNERASSVPNEALAARPLNLTTGTTEPTTTTTTTMSGRRLVSVIHGQWLRIYFRSPVSPVPPRNDNAAVYRNETAGLVYDPSIAWIACTATGFNQRETRRDSCSFLTNDFGIWKRAGCAIEILYERKGMESENEFHCMLRYTLFWTFCI